MPTNNKPWYDGSPGNLGPLYLSNFERSICTFGFLIFIASPFIIGTIYIIKGLIA